MKIILALCRPMAYCINHWQAWCRPTKHKKERKIMSIKEIIKTKKENDGYLLLDGVSAILWASEEASENDNGSRALQRWTLTADEADGLIDTGEVDEII